MYKKFTNGVVINNPKITTKTYFRVENDGESASHHPYYTMIDAASIGTCTYLLLENNAYGEEDTIVVKLPMNPYWIHPQDPTSRYKNGEHEALFIPHKFFVCSTFDDIVTALDDNVWEVGDEIEVWTEEEMNSKGE